MTRDPECCDQHRQINEIKKKKKQKTVLPIEQLKVGGVGGKPGWQGVFVEQHKTLGKAWYT